jgi:murein L,D-transpeptidase YafK
MPLKPIAFSSLVLVLALLGGSAPTAAPDDAQALLETKVDRILVEKARHQMTLLSGEHAIRRYRVALGAGGLARKRRQGDARVPEGLYRIDWRNPASAYHLSLHISYPDAGDLAAAEARGDAPGGNIMIHGLPNGFGVIGALHRHVDWTAGCIAVTDAEIEEIWRLVPDGTPIEIRP